MKTSLTVLTVTAIVGIAMSACAPSRISISDRVPAANRIAGVYVYASSDAYYEDLDCGGRPYFDEIQRELVKRGWIPVNMNKWVASETRDASRLLKEAQKRKLGYFILFSYHFSGRVGDIPCHKVYLLTTMYRVPTKKALFNKWVESKDVYLFDKYPAAEAGHYPDYYPNTTRYYSKRQVSWGDLCREALEEALSYLP